MALPRPHLVNAASHLTRAQALRTAPFSYELPQGRIALHPHHPRHDSKLLVVPRLRTGSSASLPIRSLKFRDLPTLLPSSSLLVRNATRVIPARIPALKASGGRAEILLLHPSHSDTDPADALSSPVTDQSWAAILGGKSIRPGDVLSSSVSSINNGDVDENEVTLHALITSRQRQYADISLTSSPVKPLRDVLAKLGLPPLPPYIRREAQQSDRDSFQTTYAVHDGSAAAPTAGLHVTPLVEQGLTRRKIDTVDVVLHIGTATFRQVDAEVAGGHDMHHESISVSGRAVKRLMDQVAQGLPIIALGTTSIRTIESLYWFGVRLLTGRADGNDDRKNNNAVDMLFVDQWEPYVQMDRLDSDRVPSPPDALAAVLDWCGGVDGVVHGGTNLLIVPGYPFKLTNALITNFHQPRSTLLMLVSAFYGGIPEDLAKVYGYALDNEYGFLSYGDSSIYADASFFPRIGDEHE